jgi:SIT family siderophore-iron:H+ symporter-like MFS transporter
LWFASPLTQIQRYPPGTFQRDAAIDAYAHVQRVLCTVGVALCGVLVGFACVLRDPRLGDGQSLVRETEGGLEMEMGRVGVEVGEVGKGNMQVKKMKRERVVDRISGLFRA